MRGTLTEKILKKHLVSGELVPGSEIALRMDQTLTQDATGTMAYLEYEAMGTGRVKTELSVAYVDHNTLQSGFENADGFHFTMQPVSVSVLLLIMCGLCTSVMWGAIFNLAVSGLGKYTQVASGLFMVMVCGGGILPLIQASIAKSSSYLTSFWLIFALLAYLLFYALVGSRANGETAE